jgi:hypothetical protein
VTPADLYQATHRSDDLLLDRLLARAVRERHRQRVLVAAAAAALVAVAGTGAGIGIALHGSDTQTGREIAAQSGSVHARLWLQPAAKETGLTLELSGVAPDQRCQLVAVDRAGHRSTAATWEATYSGVATIHASTATPVSELRSFVVETPAHQRLVTLVVRQ